MLLSFFSEARANSGGLGFGLTILPSVLIRAHKVQITGS